MTYQTGQITSEPDPCSVFIGIVEGLMTTHPAWEFVGEYTSTDVFRVWKNLGTVNAWGQDFFIAFRKSNATTLLTVAFEDFDLVTELVYRPVTHPAYTLTPHTDGSYSDTGLALNNTYLNPYPTLAFLTTDFNYWTVVTNNGVFMAVTSHAPTTYAGVFQSMNPEHIHEFPLVTWDMGNNDADGSGAFSRRPGVSVSMVDAFALYSHYASATAWTLLDGSIPNSIPDLYGGKALGSRFAVRHTNATGGAFRGWMYDVLIFPVDAGVEKGDTITVDGNTYVYFGNSLWVNTAAV